MKYFFITIKVKYLTIKLIYYSMIKVAGDKDARITILNDKDALRRNLFA